MARDDGSDILSSLHALPDKTPVPVWNDSALSNTSAVSKLSYRKPELGREVQYQSQRGEDALPKHGGPFTEFPRSSKITWPLQRSDQGRFAPSDSVRRVIDHSDWSKPEGHQQDSLDAVKDTPLTFAETPLATGLFLEESFHHSFNPQSSRTATDPFEDYGKQEERNRHGHESTNEYSPLSSPGPAQINKTRSERHYDREISSLRKNLESEITAIWLGESIGHAIALYYQGQRSELIPTLTQATCVAEKYDLKDLMGRAQLWKAIVFHDTGNVANIGSILSDVVSLVRDYGDEMDCYQLRKLLPLYGHQMWQHLIAQARANQQPHLTGYDSPTSRNAFEAWFKWLLPSLEKRYDQSEWPDPWIASNAAITRQPRNQAMSPQGEFVPDNAPTVSPKNSLPENKFATAGTAELLQYLMQVENEHKVAQENVRQLAEWNEELISENNRYKAVIEGCDINQAQHDNELRSRKRSKTESSVLSPGQVTACIEDCKAGKPRSRGKVQSWEQRNDISDMPDFEAMISKPFQTQIQEWQDSHPRLLTSSIVSNLGQPFGTPKSIRALYTREASESLASLTNSATSFDVYDPDLRPRPLAYGIPENSLPPANPQGILRPTSNVRKSPEIESSVAPTIESKVAPNRPNVTIPSHYPPSPRTNTRDQLQEEESRQESKQGEHSYSTTPSGPRLHARRPSLLTSSAMSPLSIDTDTVLPLTDTPAPSQLEAINPDLHKHQEQRRRSLSTSISPTSTSYEVERRRSYAHASKKLPQGDVATYRDLSTTLPNSSFLTLGSKDTRKELDAIDSSDKSIFPQPFQRLPDTARQHEYLQDDGTNLQSTDDRSSSSPEHTPSKRLSLGKSGISVGCGSPVTGVSGALSFLAAEPKSAISTTNQDESFPGDVSRPLLQVETSHILASPAGIGQQSASLTNNIRIKSDPRNFSNTQVSADPNVKIPDTQKVIVLPRLETTANVNSASTPSHSVHYRRSSAPIISSPLRTSSRLSDTGEAQNNDTPQDKLNRLVGIESRDQPLETTTIEDKEQPASSTKDFAYDDQDLGPSGLNGMPAASFPSSRHQSNASPHFPSHFTSNQRQDRSLERSSQIYQDIEDTYPPLTPSGIVSPSASTALTSSSSRGGSIRLSAVPRLNLGLARQRRQEEQQQEGSERDRGKDQVSDSRHTSQTQVPSVQDPRNTGGQKISGNMDVDGGSDYAESQDEELEGDKINTVKMDNFDSNMSAGTSEGSINTHVTHEPSHHILVNRTSNNSAEALTEDTNAHTTPHDGHEPLEQPAILQARIYSPTTDPYRYRLASEVRR